MVEDQPISLVEIGRLGQLQVEGGARFSAAREDRVEPRLGQLSLRGRSRPDDPSQREDRGPGRAKGTTVLTAGQNHAGDRSTDATGREAASRTLGAGQLGGSPYPTRAGSRRGRAPRVRKPERGKSCPPSACGHRAAAVSAEPAGARPTSA